VDHGSGTNLRGLALVWDSAVSAELSLLALSVRTLGCAPSHRRAFELCDTSPQHEHAEDLPASLEFLLHA
jgi:hypothetical protein